MFPPKLSSHTLGSAEEPATTRLSLRPEPEARAGSELGGKMSRLVLGVISTCTAMQKVANRDARVWHGATENGP
jgi:hypothetical protein